jgi:hypothetical protein
VRNWHDQQIVEEKLKNATIILTLIQAIFTTVTPFMQRST